MSVLVQEDGDPVSVGTCRKLCSNVLNEERRFGRCEQNSEVLRRRIDTFC